MLNFYASGLHYNQPCLTSFLCRFMMRQPQLKPNSLGRYFNSLTYNGRNSIHIAKNINNIDRLWNLCKGWIALLAQYLIFCRVDGDDFVAMGL